MQSLAQRLMRTFLGEFEERLQALNDDLVALEKSPAGAARDALLTTLFRTAHSLKGAAGSVGVTPVEMACHGLEERFAALRDGKAPLDAAAFEALFAGADAIARAGATLRSGGPPPMPEPVAQPMAQPAPERRPEPIPEPTSLPAATERLAAGPTIRVAVDKLDELIARGGELVIAHEHTGSRAAEAEAAREFTHRWRSEWEALDVLLTRACRAATGDGMAAFGARDAEHLLAGLAGTRENLRRLDRDLDRLAGSLAGDSTTIARAAAAVVAEATRTRMQPFAEACSGLERVVRDAAKSAGRSARLVLRGQEVELDRAIIDRLRDPLIHLVRNAVDHGIEPPEERRAAGKPATGEIVVAATARGASVEVRVGDDGRGLAIAAISARAQRDNLPASDANALAQHIFRPGFSTVASVTEISGRGVGLDAVKTTVEALRGTIAVSFEPGHGTEFLLRLPLTLTTSRVVTVRCGEQILAFDTIAIVRLLQVDPDEVRTVEGEPVLTLGGAPVALRWLDQLLGIPPGEDPAMLTVVLATAGVREVGFVVDALVAEQEVTVRGLGPRLRRVRHIGAATILASGQVVPILHTGELIETAVQRRSPRRDPSARETTLPLRRRVVLADDSFTTRTLEKSILEGAGYEVAAFADGAAAWASLQTERADVVVSDIEMPRLDGFGLTEAIRAAPHLRDLPVILVTSRESDADRERGLAAGANAYLVKSGFDQQKLLDSLDRLL